MKTDHKIISKKLIAGTVILLTVFMLTQLSKAESRRIYQMQKFMAPASADALKNPTLGDANALLEGKKLYTANCVVCHGPKGMGDGVAAPGLSRPPANHSSAAVQKLSDGALFWMVTTGNNPMPSYKSTFSETQRWELVDYIRTLAKPAKK